jgi:uncharacterized protein (DUF2267 family)
MLDVYESMRQGGMAMQFDEFIGKVQHRARLASRGEAERVTRAVLETLAERLAGGEAKDLAAQLPMIVKDYILEYPHAGEGRHMSLKEFYKRVVERLHAPMPEAAFWARAVMSVVQEAVSAGEIEDVKHQLGPDYAPLFEWEGPR